MRPDPLAPNAAAFTSMKDACGPMELTRFYYITDIHIYILYIIGRVEASLSLSVEFVEFSLYIYIGLLASESKSTLVC